jgi:putative Ca2+/H+ antiporter (TMEM165/GDT1 family)
MLSTFLTCTVAVFGAELLGDKTLFSSGALAARYSRLAILAGLVPACCAKMLVAVLIGHSLAGLPLWLTTLVSTVTLLVAAVLVCGHNETARRFDRPMCNGRIAWTSFATIFFTEWGDPGQLVAASLVVQHKAALLVWFGGSLAMFTKAIIGMTFGVSLRYCLSERAIRGASVGGFVLLAFTSALGLWR